MKRILIAILLGMATPMGAFSQTNYNNVQLPDPEQERKAVELMETIRCVVCQGQSITGSNADLAADMRGMIRERIARGEKPEDIRKWLIQNYGEWVSFKPQMGGNSAPLWLLPLLALAGGVYLAHSRFKNRRG